MLKQLDIDQQRTELINDLVATSTVMEEVWRYHPDNPDKKDVVSEYEVLNQISEDIENELEDLEK